MPFSLRWLVPVPAPSPVPRHLISSSRPRLAPLCCLLGLSVLPSSSIISGNLLACRLASRLSSCPSSRFSPRLASRPARSLSRAVRLAVIDGPALLVGWLGAGRDGSRSLSRHCPPALPSLLACSDVGRLRLFRLRRSACSVGGSICVCIVMAKLYI